MALFRLTFADELANTRHLSDLEKQGLIQAFGFTYKLAWNVIKDFYQYQGEDTLQGKSEKIELKRLVKLLKGEDK